MSLDPKSVAEAADLLVHRRPALFLTGAGVSVESGIPDFRSRGGLWERFNPMEYAEIHAFRANPRKVWRMLRELEGILDEAEPNAGHRALARLEELEVVSAVVTQNIDNLHQEGGSHRVIEFHGNGRRLVCLECGFRIDAGEVRDRQGDAPEGDALEPPTCDECGAILKPEVIFFGEPIPEAALNDSFMLASNCGVMVIAGTSATVAPCSALPFQARRSGAALIEINPERTSISEMADVSLRGPWAQAMPALTEAVEGRLEAKPR